MALTPVLKKTTKKTKVSAIHGDLRKCTQSPHEWGRCNRMFFDPGKEELQRLPPTAWRANRFEPPDEGGRPKVMRTSGFDN